MCNRFRYFWINCNLSFFVFLCSALVVGQDVVKAENVHFYFAGAWATILPAFVWGVAEVVAYFRRILWLEQLLGVWCGLLASVSVVLGGYLALQIPWDAPSPRTDVLGAAVVLLIEGYMTMSCYCRCRKPRGEIATNDVKAEG